MTQRKVKTALPLILIAVTMLTMSLVYAENGILPVLSSQNLAPIAENMSFTTYKNIAFESTLRAKDPEGDSVSFRLMDTPARGSVTLAEDNSGRFTYTPYDNKTGKDSFSYAAIDEHGNTSATATVKIKIEKNKAKLTYADMEGHPAHYAALCLAAEGIFKGESLGGEYFFRPDEEVTRSEFIAMAMKTAGYAPLTGVVRTGFYDDDVIAAWAKPYVASALKNGTVRGVFNESGQIVFQGDAAISYAEAGVLLNRLFGISDVANIPVPVMAEGEIAPTWSYQAAANLDSVHVMSMSTVRLNATLTRSEAATLLAGALTLKK